MSTAARLRAVEARLQASLCDRAAAAERRRPGAGVALEAARAELRDAAWALLALAEALRDRKPSP